MDELGSIWAEVSLNYAKYDQGIDHIARQNQWIDAETQKAMNRIGDHYDKMGRRLSVAVTAPLTLLARQWIRTFADFQQSMANTQSVMGATADELEAMTAAARKAGEETVYKASQAADALYYLAQSGMDAAQSIGALDGVLTLATATGSGLAFTSEVIAASLSQFSLEAQDATRVANLFAAANANSLASIDKLAGSMKNAGPVAAGFGYSIEETTAALMGLYNAGFAGEQAGNILKRALAELANPTGDATNVIKELKLSVNDLHPEMNSLADIIDTLNERGITSTQSLRLFGQIAGPGMNQLLSQGGDSIRAFIEQITGTNKAAEQAAIQLDTLSGDMKILASVYESLAIQMSDNFEPAMRGVVQRVTELLAGIRDLNPETQRLMVTVAGFALAAGPTMLIIGQLLKALPLLMGPAGLIYGGVAAVTALAFAMTGSARDMREFYQQSIETSRATQDQADQLRSLVEEYKALEGKPDKSEEEHRRLETVMNEIITLQPQLAKGYKTIDEAIKANIDTLETYIERLETQSELHLRVASLEYLRTRNQLELELNRLVDERDQKESQIQGRLDDASRLVRLQNEIERAFMDWQEALELGSEDAIQKAQDEMRRILVDWKPDHVAGYGVDGPWGVWVDGLIRDAESANSKTSKLLEELDEIRADIAKIEDTQTHAEAVFAELERRARGEALKTGGSSIVEEEEEVIGVVVRSAEEMEEALRAEMALYRARIELVRNMGDEYGAVYGDLEGLHEKYIQFLEKNVVDDALTEAFRGNVLAVELGNMRDELEKVINGPKTKDPDTIVSDQMQVYQAELELLRLGVQQYIDELGSLEDHLQKYYDYLQTQTTDSGLTAITKLRVQEALKVVKEELDKVTLSAVDRWNKVLDMIGNYGPQADTLREALDGGKIHVDFGDLEKMEQHIKNYYQYLVESEKITLGQHLEVLKYQLRQVSVGTDEWLQLWREVAKVQKDLEKEDKRAYDNEPLRKQLRLFEELKHQNDEVVSSYEQQIKWLQENVLEVEGLVRTTEELMSIENEIFALRMTNYRALAETENWTLEQQLENLDQYVGAYAQSFDQIQAITQLRRQLTEKQNEDELRAAQEISYKAQEVEIQRLRNKGMLEEAEIAESSLRLNRELDQFKGNQAMIELAYQSHRERLKAISKNYAEIEARDLADKVAEEIKIFGDLRDADLLETKAWIDERVRLFASMDDNTGRYAVEELGAFQLRLEREEERRFEDRQRQEEQWQNFLIQSRQISATSALEEQIAGIESELELTAEGNERKIELERQLQRAKHDLAKQSLEDQRSLLNAMTIEEEIDLEDRLDIIRRMREGYEELYGNLYRFSTEWQELRKLELELEEEKARKEAISRIKSIQYNKDDLASLRNKRTELLKLIESTKDHIKQQEYLNELFKNQEDIKKAEEATSAFFGKISPEFSDIVNQTDEFFRLIREAPQAFDNMRSSMGETFGEYGDGIAALYGAMAGYSGAGGGPAGIIAGFTGAIAGLTGDPIFAAITAGVSFISQLFDPGPMPQEMKGLRDGIKDMNKALEEYGVAYKAVEADIRKTYFLIFQTGWEFTNEEAAKAGYKAGETMIRSMNESLSTLGSAMASTIAGETEWKDFEQVLGQQLRRILMEQVMLATEYEKQAKLIAGMMQEFATDGYDEKEVEKIRRAIRRLAEEGERAWEEFGGDMLDEWFPKDDTIIQHEIRGVQITRLSGQDRDMFLESFRPLANLDRLPGLMSEQMFEVFQTFQMAEIGTIQAQELLIQQVLIQQVNVNLSSVTDVHGLVTELVREALGTASGSGY